MNLNSRFPLLFSAPIPNIATKISKIPHPANPIVDPLLFYFKITSTVAFWRSYKIINEERSYWRKPYEKQAYLAQVSSVKWAKTTEL